MFSTPLIKALREHATGETRPLHEVEYCGAITAARFSNPQQEFDALMNRCGLYDLGYRARISLEGSDRVRWLNGMVTNNIRDLPVGNGVYAFLLNPQGRILGDMVVHNEGEFLTVETDRSQLETLLATFDHYIIMDDVEVSNTSDQWTALGVVGPASRSILNAAGISVPEMQPLQTLAARCDCDCGCVTCTIVRGEETVRESTPGFPHYESYEIWLAPENVAKTWRALIAAGATPTGTEALEMRRVTAGIPLFGADIRERDLPQETEQLRALNFNKGCYVGQEIVERIRSRGNVHRKFTGFQFAGSAEIAPGSKIISSEKEVGEITSVALLRSPSGERTLALGYIRREVGIPGREVMIGGFQFIVAQLPMEGVGTRQVQESLLQPR